MDTINIKNITPLTDFRNNIKKYIEEINTNKKTYILTQHGKSAAVVLNAEKYQEMQDQLELMRKVAVGLEDIENKKLYSEAEVFSEMERIISGKISK